MWLIDHSCVQCSAAEFLITLAFQGYVFGGKPPRTIVGKNEPRRVGVSKSHIHWRFRGPISKPKKSFNCLSIVPKIKTKGILTIISSLISNQTCTASLLMIWLTCAVIVLRCLSVYQLLHTAHGMYFWWVAGPASTRARQKSDCRTGVPTWYARESVRIYSERGRTTNAEVLRIDSEQCHNWSNPTFHQGIISCSS